MVFKIDKVSIQDIELMDEIKEISKRYNEMKLYEQLGYTKEEYEAMKAGLIYPKKKEAIILKQRPIERDETFDTKATPSLFECAICKWECTDTYSCDEIKYCPGCGRRIVKVMVIEDTEEGDSDEK